MPPGSACRRDRGEGFGLGCVRPFGIMTVVALSA